VPYADKVHNAGFEFYIVIWPCSEGPYAQDHEELLLTNPNPPDITQDDIIRWKMTQRQVRLESRWYDDALQAELGPEASLERLAELRNDRAQFLKERYWVDVGYVRAVSTANPHPRYDWASIGG
jgi:hypothetical protein